METEQETPRTTLAAEIRALADSGKSRPEIVAELVAAGRLDQDTAHERVRKVLNRSKVDWKAAAAKARELAEEIGHSRMRSDTRRAQAEAEIAAAVSLPPSEVRAILGRDGTMGRPLKPMGELTEAQSRLLWARIQKWSRRRELGDDNREAVDGCISGLMRSAYKLGYRDARERPGVNRAEVREVEEETP